MAISVAIGVVEQKTRMCDQVGVAAQLARVVCTVIRRVGFVEYEVEWHQGPPDADTCVVLLEAWFEPIFHCVQYEMFVRVVSIRQPQSSGGGLSTAPAPKPRARFIELIDIRRTPWCAAIHRRLWFPGKYVDGETFEGYVERTKTGGTHAPTVSFEKLRWMRWNTYNALVHMFGEIIVSIELNRYIEQQKLLEMADIRDWLRDTEAQRRCPFRIHPEVLRAMFGHTDPDLVNDVAVIEEMKYAMCKYQSPYVTSTQFMRVLNFCGDVSGAVKRLIERNVVRKIGVGADGYQLWFAGDETALPLPEALVTDGEPVWDLVHARVRWRRASVAPGQMRLVQPYEVYKTLEKLEPLPRKEKRLFLHQKIFGDQSGMTRTVRSVIESTDWCQKVMFIYAYDRSLHRPTSISYSNTKLWRLMRSRISPFEYVFVQETVRSGTPVYMVHDLIKGERGASAVYTYANVMTLMGMYSCVEAFSFDKIPKTLMAKCDLVVLFTKRSSPARAAIYLHNTLLQSPAVSVLAVGEWGEC